MNFSRILNLTSAILMNHEQVEIRSGLKVIFLFFISDNFGKMHSFC